jgi:hypothetical protein
MAAVLSLHDRLAYVLVLYYAAVGLWGLWLGVRNSGPTSSFRGAIVIATVAAIAQGIFGVLAFFFLGGPRETLHPLYGFALVLAMPLAASIVHDREPRGQSVALGIAALFTAGLAIRGITTS